MIYIFIAPSATTSSICVSQCEPFEVRGEVLVSRQELACFETCSYSIVAYLIAVTIERSPCIPNVLAIYSLRHRFSFSSFMYSFYLPIARLELQSTRLDFPVSKRLVKLLSQDIRNTLYCNDRSRF